MEDVEFRELFHGLTARMERFEVRLDALEKTLTDFRVEMRGRLDAIERRQEGQESRLNDKASTVVVSLWGGTLAVLIGAAVAVVKWV